MVSVMGGIERRRRRTRSGGAAEGAPRLGPTPRDLAGLNGPFALTSAVQDPTEASEMGATEPDRIIDSIETTDSDRDDSGAERGLRGLVGGGSSQVTVTAAMRARDAARPRPEDLAAAETELVIIRRGWVPRDELPRPSRQR
jgi:hypothetical protein